MSDTRYPYTIACDFIREHVTDLVIVAGEPLRTPTISRSEASQAMKAFETVFGLSHEDMAKKIADYAKARQS